jgi:hypothetical protein
VADFIAETSACSLPIIFGMGLYFEEVDGRW